MSKTAISPTREENYPEWYQQVVKASELAENAPVRGCMVVKPWGWKLWENIQWHLNAKFKEVGAENAYFPLFIPLSYLEKEAKHVEGFAKECAVVTHHRLEQDKEGNLIPAGPLEEPLVVRPTSETIIGESFAKWITSYRDLPLKINQWANVVRWEMRPRIFLRTAEFLWQEGHTVHATKEEALSMVKQMHKIYSDFGHNVLALPFITGEKTETERFPGATHTYTIEAMMQDRKALQGGTSHFLGQNFSKSSNIRFRSASGEEEFGWTTSWGVTTRLIGAMIMAHSDDDGLILPPRIASAHIVILPVLHKEEVREEVLAYCHKLAEKLKGQAYHGQNLEVIIDERDMRGGEKTWNWIKKGIPVRLEVGPRDIAEDKVCLMRRDKGVKDKQFIPQDECVQNMTTLLDEIQKGIYDRALVHRDANIVKIDDKDKFYAFFTPKNKEKPEIHGGFAFTHWCGDPKVEEQIQKDLSVTIRCIPDSMEIEPGTCPFTGKPSPQRVIFAKSY
ncbi:MAG: proline--tRNA ligase [Simkaniaceae bacterium]|nr:proline--tRNA ligase [Candidatus Sacchlamyda saccharinae]